MSMIGISAATMGDLESIYGIDAAATGDATRREFLASEVREGKCLIARIDGVPAGFAVVERSFFAQNMISMLVVHPEKRRKGVGQALIQFAESMPASFFEQNRITQPELASRRAYNGR